jgi:uncharacterized protein DUF2798
MERLRPRGHVRRIIHGRNARESRMSAKERFILASAMSSVMVAVVTLVATWLNLGLRRDFVLQWGEAYIIGWPIAALVGFMVLPLARRVTARILTLL